MLLFKNVNQNTLEKPLQYLEKPEINKNQKYNKVCKLFML